MSIWIRFMTLLLLLQASFLSYAQEKSYQYQLDGTYPAQLPGVSSIRKIRFTIIWNEKNQDITGVYSDDFFSLNSPVSGQVGILGRVFNIKLPRIIQNVSNLSLTSNMGTVMVYMKDQTGMTVNEANIQAAVVTKADYSPEEQSACDVGFGVLSGYCGLYRGTLKEARDSNLLCNLPDYGFRLELSEDARINLYFYYSDTTIGIPTHSLGALPSVPVTPNLNISYRHCGLLAGTNFPAASCQQLTLNGNFTEAGEERNFKGQYTIKDEQTNNSCAYDLVLERDKVY